MAMIRQELSKIRSQKPIIYHGLILGLYVLLAAVLTYPVVTNMTGAIAGRADAWQVLYILWYTKQALLGGNPNLTMTFTNYLFYPHGVPMIFSSFSLFSQLIGIPLQMLFGLPAAYNIIWLLSFILAGYGTFLLVRYLTGNDMAAFVSGIVFAFSPYHFSQAQMHIGATTIEWVPFCALFLMKMFRDKSLKSAFFAGIFFIMVALSDSQYMMFMGLFTGLLFAYELYYILREKPGTIANSTLTGSRAGALKNLLARYAVFAIVALAISLPINYDLLRIATSGDNFLYQDPGASVGQSSDLAGLVIPSPLHPIFGSWATANLYSLLGSENVEHVNYIGITVLALSILALVARRKEKEVKLWAISAVISALMTLGPDLHIMGVLVYPGTIPMPYLLAYKYIPFMDNCRMPTRFDVIAMLSFAVLAGYGLAYLAERLKTPRYRMAIACIAAVLVVFEFWSVPAISIVDTPSFYSQLGQDKGQYALLEIPASTSYDAGVKCEYYETISGKPIVGGTVPRTPDYAADFESNTPLINDLTYTGSDNPISEYDIFNQNETDIGNYVLDYYDIRYVILHTDFMPAGDFPRTDYDMELLNDTLNAGPAYAGDGLIVYKVGPTEPKLFMVPGNGWYSPEYDGNTTWRWMGNNSTTEIIAPENGTYSLSFNVTGILPYRMFDISVNGKQIYRQAINTSWTEASIPVDLNAGDNVLTINSEGESMPYGSIHTPGGVEIRRVSLAVSNVSVEMAGG